MTIKEIETLSGLPRANIRYYESEGLIAPKRAENGYREYSQADAEVLLRVKLLRALGLRIDTIKSLAAGTLMLGDALDARLEELHAEQENLDAAGRVAAGLRQAHAEFSTLDAAGYLGELLAASQTALRQDVKPYVHAPVRRYIARSFDLLLCSLPWYLVLQAAGVDPKARLTSIWLSILGMVTMLVLEPLLLRLFGTTPGKWLMGLRVTDENGQRLPLAAAWRRTWRATRDGDKFPVLISAISKVSESEHRGLLNVITELRKENTPIANHIANHIDSFTNYDFAHLLFSDGTAKNTISLDNQLNIIQVADLVLPDKDTTFDEYTTIELLSVAMLIVISTFALDFINSDRSIFKIVDLDEAWAFLNVAQGETLSNKLVRAGRAMNAGVYFVTQSSGDVSKESLKNNIGLKFAFRSTDTNEIKQTLEFFGLDSEDENNQKRLRDLENGQCLMQDLYGRVGVVQIHPVFVELLHAFDTRPPIKSEVDLE